MQPLIPYFEQPSIDIPLPGGNGVTLWGFGVMVALGFLLGGRVAMNRASSIGLDPEAINRLIGWLVLGTFVGGHLGYILMYEPAILQAPIDWFKVINVFDGLSSYGGFIACVPITVWFFRSNKLPLWPYLDCIAIGLALGWGLGRTGCFIAHDHIGSVTETFPLALYGAPASKCPGPACHDMGLYEALWSYSMFLLFLALDRKPRVPGFYPALLGLIYGPTRFVMDFARPLDHDPRYFFGLTGAQFWSLVATLLCAYLLFNRMGSNDEPVWKDRADWVPPDEREKSVQG